MSKLQVPDDSEPVERPGKTRTWWHPMLARLLDFELATAYQVQDEVLVGKLPLRVDILLIRRESGELPEANRRDLSVLLPLFGRLTLVEFKGPTDSLQRGDLAQLVGCAFLWHSQQAEVVAQRDMSLIVLAPKGNQAFRDEVRGFDWQLAEQRAGVHRISGSPFSLWLVETDVMAELGDPLLSLVSRVFLKQHRRIMKQLQETGRTALLCYALQLIDWFRSLGERFTMTHSGTQYMEVLEDELQRVLDGLSPERRLRGLPPKERLRGLSPEERLEGLTDEQITRLRELLDRSQNG